MSEEFRQSDGGWFIPDEAFDEIESNTESAKERQVFCCTIHNESGSIREKKTLTAPGRYDAYRQCIDLAKMLGCRTGSVSNGQCVWRDNPEATETR